MFTDDLCAFIKNKFENNYNNMNSYELKFNNENKDPCILARTTRNLVNVVKLVNLLLIHIKKQDSECTRI